MLRLPAVPFFGVALLLALPMFSSAQEPAPEQVVETPVLADAAPAPIEINGSFVPSQYRQIELWPKEYKGGFLIREVMPHGAMVERGQVIAVLDLHSIEEQLHQAELALDSKRFNLEIDAARAEMEEHAAERALEAAEYTAENAERALHAWAEFELQFNHAQAEMSALYQTHGIEDATDELEQLEAMYEEDELTDATEEIVLKRSRRNLKRSHASQELADARREFTAEYNWRLSSESKERALENAMAKLQRQRHQTRLDAAARQRRLDLAKHELERAAERFERLREDAEMMKIRAPRKGILLHGAATDYRPGKVAPRYRHGGNLSARKILFTIAAPGKFAIALKLGENQIGDIRNGMEATAEIVGPGRKQALVGELELQAFPLPSSAGGPENQYEGVLHLSTRVNHVVPGQRAKVSFPQK